MNATDGIGKQIFDWFDAQNWTPYPFQTQTWEACVKGKCGIVNAPTGSGKTFALFLGLLSAFHQSGHSPQKSGLKVIWISPIRALAKEIKISMERALNALDLSWQVAIRSGDTSTSARKKQWSSPPDILITTPESVHILMSKKGYAKYFIGLFGIVIDEWHELMGSKRGVQVELALSRLKSLNPGLLIWGISATIGNLHEALDVLLGPKGGRDGLLVTSDIRKEIAVHSIFPDNVEKYSWGGHLGIALADKIMPIIEGSASTLIFTNTRGQCEIWYQKILDLRPDLAGVIAMHHGSISRELRDWVEEALYDGRLKAVVCTSSLDLGVDFRPVETIIQIGSPKSVARFVQRAGRSGHQPEARSEIFFLPTHALELVEAAALRRAVSSGNIELRTPYLRSWDVLIQYLMTLAVSDGFDADQIYEEVKSTFCYSSMTRSEWKNLLNFLLHGSQSLKAYDEYKKVVIDNAIYRTTDRRIAQRHRMSIGTIVSEAMINVRFLSGGRIGAVEEWFASHLEPGDSFWFAGRPLELVMIKDMTMLVRKSKKVTRRIPSYLGGRLPLSSEMSEVLREKIYNYTQGKIEDAEVERLKPLWTMQNTLSILPREDEFLIEYFESKEGYHLLMYPFEGRFVHEGMGALLAKRITNKLSITFSIAMNDYGFELLSDKPIDVENIINKDLFSMKNLITDIQGSINATELARRKFRDIARISGLIFQGYPGKIKKQRHLQASSSLLFDVFRDYEPNSLLFLQTFDEVMTFQLEEARLRNALNRIQGQYLLFAYPSKPTPLAFPIIVDRMREKMTSEKLEDRIRKMTLDFTK